jgi:hypothetical protein
MGRRFWGPRTANRQAAEPKGGQNEDQIWQRHAGACTCTMYLELRNRPMSREHARPQPPAGSRRYGGARRGESERQRSRQPRCRPGSPATVPTWCQAASGPRPSRQGQGQGTKLDPLDHTQPISRPQLPTGPRAQGAKGEHNGERRTAANGERWPGGHQAPAPV